MTRAQTHHRVLRIAKLFFRWTTEQGYLRVNPFQNVKPVGKPHVGKLQLRIDEARRLTDVLVHAAQQSQHGAIAVFCQLMLGLRSGEVLAIMVRDLDDGGRVLWIPKGKTENARRRLEVPEVLQPFLLGLATDKQPERLVFEGKRAKAHSAVWLWKQVQRYCNQADVPVVCPHSLRGLHSSLAIAAGCTSSAVASALGHGSFAITAKHYVDPDTLRNSTLRRVAEALSDENTDEITPLLERLRALPREARNELLRTLDGTPSKK